MTFPALKIPKPTKPTAGGDSMAVREAAIALTDDFEKEARRNDHRRTENKKNFLWTIHLIVTLTLILGFILMAIIWFVHLVFPNWRWIDPHNLARLESILFSAILSPFVTQYIRDGLLKA